MTRTEHLLTILMEETAEVAQRASKALRFGLREVQPGQFLTNAERVALEMADLLCVYQMLASQGLLPQPDLSAMQAKREKVEQFLSLSRELGTLREAEE